MLRATVSCMRLRIRVTALRLLGRLRGQPAKARRIGDRLLEGAREVGVLLIAFAPLDAALAEREEVRRFLLLFLGLGCFLFILALGLEWRRDDDN